MTVLQAPPVSDTAVTAPPLAPEVVAASPRRTVRQKLRSLFLVSLAIYVAINATLSFATPFKFNPYKFSYKGWAWWTLNDLRQTPDVHNIAFLGSSLMVSAIAGCDANYLKKELDLTKYHHVSYMDDQLKQKFGGEFNSFNLSAPGQMPSDAFLSLKAMVNTANRPDVVFYGVAPRDFIDSTLAGPNDTEPFKYLTRIVNIDDVMNAEFRSLWSKLDYCLQKTDYLYYHSLDCRLDLAKATSEVMDKIAPTPHSDHPFTWWDRVRIMPGYCPGEIHPSAVVSSPLAAEKVAFKDNTKEYQQRYRTPDPETYKTQMYFLRKLAEYCHRERIELVLVNMPIMYYNARMLPPGVYEKYVQSLHEFAWNHDVMFYDLCNFKAYKQEDFHDTVHLNAFGAKKLFDALIAKLAADRRAATLLSLSGEQLEKHKALAAEPRTTY